MSAVHEQYAREMHASFGYFASWPPNATISLGDVGVVRRMGFRRLQNLSDLGIGLAVKRAGRPADLEYASAGRVNVAVEAGVGGSSDSGTGFSIRFTQSGATFFQAARCVVESAANLADLEAEILRLHADGAWKSEYAVVTSVLRTGPAAVVIAEQKDAEIRLKASAPAVLPQLPIANAAASISVVAESGIAWKAIMAEGATPLFSVMGLRRRLGGARELRFRQSAPQGRSPELAALADKPETLSLISWDEFAAG